MGHPQLKVQAAVLPVDVIVGVKGGCDGNQANRQAVV